MIGSLLDSVSNTLKRFRTDKDYRELLRTSFFALLVRLIGVFTGFLVTVLTTRFYGANALGVVSICLAILSFAAVFGKLGLDVALIKYISMLAINKNRPAIKGVYLEALKIIFPATVLISTLLYFFAPWMASEIFHKPYLAGLLRINAWLALPLVLILINSECIRALKRIRTYTFLQTSSVSLFACILLFIFSFITKEKDVPVYVQFICITFSGILSTLLWIRYSKFNTEKAKSEIALPDLMRTSSPMFTTTLMQLTMSWAATLILAAYVSEAEVGIYNALVRISVFTNITILAVNSLAQPRFAELFASKSFDTMKKHATESSRLIFLTSLPLFILLGICPGWILSVFGKEFPGNEKALYILLAGQLIVCFAGLPSQILNMTGQQHALRNIAIVSALVNIISCFIMIPRWGIIGACYAQLAGTFMWNLLSSISVKRHLGFAVFFKIR